MADVDMDQCNEEDALAAGREWDMNERMNLDNGHFNIWNLS
jgi:hypothetical protein